MKKTREFLKKRKVSAGSIHPQNSAKVSHPQHYLNSSKSGNSSQSLGGANGEKVLGKFLGIDFGQAKIGLALADTETKIAFGYDTIKKDKNFLTQLEAIIQKESVETVVIGRAGYVYDQNVETPRRGVSTMPVGKAILQLAENLKKLGMAVEYQEEMFTTKMAQANLREKGEKKVGKKDDKEAARIILQSWLDK